jgi:hypothetical protein
LQYGSFMDNDLQPWEPDITRDEMLRMLHSHLADSVQDIIKLRWFQTQLRAKILEIQADPNWTAK